MTRGQAKDFDRLQQSTQKPSPPKQDPVYRDMQEVVTRMAYKNNLIK